MLEKEGNVVCHEVDISIQAELEVVEVAEMDHGGRTPLNLSEPLLAVDLVMRGAYNRLQLTLGANGRLETQAPYRSGQLPRVRGRCQLLQRLPLSHGPCFMRDSHT